MSSPDPKTARSQFNVLDSAPHTLYECRTAEEFRVRFEATTGNPLQQVTDRLIRKGAPRALFCVGSIPLGMGTRGSDVDMILLVDSKDVLASGNATVVNNSQQAAFFNETDALLVGTFMQLHEGILVDVQVAITPAIRSIYARLRRSSPELNETEIRILGRLRAGWLLWESESYLEQNAINGNDRTLPVYCCTRNFVIAINHERKAIKALELHDVALALQLGRASAEMGYLAYFASEGLVYLGAKWLAQLGFARGAQDRLGRHPLLKRNLQLLFPIFGSSEEQAARYLGDVRGFLKEIRGLIEEQILFRIAFKACVQIALA
jgi:hypothetical protein